jgi:transposase
MIADYLVTNDCNDEQILSGFASKIKETLSESVISVVADKGYDSIMEIEACVFSGIIPYVGFKNDKDERILTIPYVNNKISSKQRESNKPEDIKNCLSAGVLPACYEGSNISVEVNEINHIGCFNKVDDSTVICPMGQTLNRTKFKGEGSVFACRTACRICTNRCTPSKNFKAVYFGPDTKHIAARMYGKAPPVNVPPENFRPHNAFFTKQVEKTITIRIKDDIPKQKKRLSISEHPFGTIKRHHGAYFLLCKGIKKATAELGLSFLVYNLKRAINIKGVGQIMAAINEA